MIDRQKLEAHYNFIGSDKIPHYIDIYLRTCKNFLGKIENYHRTRDRKRLLELVHKVKGSVLNFFDSDLEALLECLETKIEDDFGSISQEDFSLLRTQYTRFLEELISLKSYYKPD
jgi:hypothetical protein